MALRIDRVRSGSIRRVGERRFGSKPDRFEVRARFGRRDDSLSGHATGAWRSGCLRFRTMPFLAGKKRGHPGNGQAMPAQRSEEHTSELQSHLNLVCRLLLEKKKKREDLL